MTERLFDPVTGKLNRAEVMRRAHRTTKYMRAKGADGWTLSDSLRLHMREAMGRRAQAAARGDFVRSTILGRLVTETETGARPHPLLR